MYVKDTLCDEVNLGESWGRRLHFPPHGAVHLSLAADWLRVIM